MFTTRKKLLILKYANHHLSNSYAPLAVKKTYAKKCIYQLHNSHFSDSSISKILALIRMFKKYLRRLFYCRNKLVPVFDARLVLRSQGNSSFLFITPTWLNDIPRTEDVHNT